MRKEYLALLAAGCVAANAANVNYDLLGRKDSKMNSPMVYKNVDYSKTKKNDQQKLGSSLAKQAVGLKGNAQAIVGKSGPNGYGFIDCSNYSSGCGNSMNLSNGTLNSTDYFNKANAKFINVVSQEKNRLSPDFNYVTAGPTRSNLSGYTMTETPYNFNVPQSNAYATFNDVNGYLGRVIKSKTNVGVYVSGNAVPVRLNKENDTYAPFILSDNVPMSSYGRTPDNEMYVSRMFRLTHLFSDQSSVFAAKTRPSNPAGENPQIYVGLHGENVNSSNSWYATKAKDLDNYIYWNRTVEVVAAGNTGKLSPEGYAANAITVGARNAKSNVVTGYQEATYTNGTSYNKPEIYNYTNFYVNDYKRVYSYPGKQDKTFLPYYEGSESAAAITAGMVSNMLSYNEFYKWHPEVVKAVLVNASRRSSLKYNQIVFDKNSYNTHHSYYFIGDVNKLMKVYNDHPATGFISGADLYDGKKEIRLNFGRSALGGSGAEGFCATIAWLSSGSDIVKLGKLPQNFEIFGYKRNGNQHASQNISGIGVDLLDASFRDDEQKGSPYKTICVDSRSTDPYHELSVRIVLDEEDSRSENYGQMVLGLDIMPY